MHQHLLPAGAGTRFLVVMPTGTGKTVVIALSPFLLSAQKTLIVCPNLEITEQVRREVKRVYSRHHPLGAKLSRAPEVSLFKAGAYLHYAPTSHLNLSRFWSLKPYHTSTFKLNLRRVLSMTPTSISYKNYSRHAKVDACSPQTVFTLS